MNSRFRKLLVVGLLLIVAVAGIVITRRGEPTVAPPASITPTPTPVLEVLRVTTIYPNPETGMLGNDSSIIFTFDRPVDHASLNVAAVPPQSFTITPFPQNPRAVIVVPNQKWVINSSYDITIRAGARSTDGKAMVHEDLLYRFRTGEAPLPKYDRPQV